MSLYKKVLKVRDSFLITNFNYNIVTKCHIIIKCIDFSKGGIIYTLDVLSLCREPR